MAQPFCTGPAAAFVSVAAPGGARLPVFLGHSQDGFKIEERPAFEPLMNDLGGSKIPFDTQDMGEDAVVTGVLTRWNETVFSAIAATRAGGVAGATATGDMGLFMGGEAGGHVLWLAFPYGAIKPAMAAGGLPPGRRYPFAMLESKGAEVGTRAMKRFVAWHCLRLFTPAAGGLGTFVLYDGNMTGLPAIN